MIWTLFTAFIISSGIWFFSDPKYDFDFLGAWTILLGISAIILAFIKYYKKIGKEKES